MLNSPDYKTMRIFLFATALIHINYLRNNLCFSCC
jgi:hypothetical protein